MKVTYDSSFFDLMSSAGAWNTMITAILIAAFIVAAIGWIVCVVSENGLAIAVATVVSAAVAAIIVINICVSAYDEADERGRLEHEQRVSIVNQVSQGYDLHLTQEEIESAASSPALDNAFVGKKKEPEPIYFGEKQYYCTMSDFGKGMNTISFFFDMYQKDYGERKIPQYDGFSVVSPVADQTTEEESEQSDSGE